MSTPYRDSRQKGMIRELLKTPVCKDILRDNLRALQHISGRSIVRAVMEEDPEVFLGLIVTIPSLANAFINSISELGERLESQYPPGVLNAFIESIVKEIDVDSAGRCGAVWKNIASSLWETSPEFRTEITNLVLTAGPRTMASGINALAGAVNSIEKERPGTISSFMTAMFSNLDRPGASNAVKSLAGAFLDQKWHLFSWLFGLASSRIKKRFGMIGRA
jgi:hypothetical protein